MEYSQVVRHSFLVRVFKGSNPFIPIKKFQMRIVLKLNKKLICFLQKILLRCTLG